MRRKKKEFSKLYCVVISIPLVFLGCWMIWKYYNLVELAIQNGSSSVPDSALPIAGVTAIITPLVSYLLYQAKLKNSRNKYGISESGIPYCMPEEKGN
jgi:hypothetical protein